MMHRFFIQEQDGSPVNHPISLRNLMDVIEGFNPDSPPAGFVEFIRVAPPELGPYEKDQTVTYELVGGKYTDVFRCSQMTDDEKTQKQNAVREGWAENGYPSWVFNEETCTFEAPVNMPEDGNDYIWDEPTTSWVEV